jgi:hypothetical protein
VVEQGLVDVGREREKGGGMVAIVEEGGGRGYRAEEFQDGKKMMT